MLIHENKNEKPTVLLTGGAGFLGSALAKMIIKNKYKLIITIRNNTNLRNIESIKNVAKLINLDQTTLHQIFESQRINIVIHTACNYGKAGEAVSEIVESNVTFGLRLIEAAIMGKSEAFINTGTLLNANINSYALSKSHFLEYLKNYKDAIKIINIRPDIIYGEGDSTNKMIPWLIDQIINKVSTINMTDGNQTRNFTNLEDMVVLYEIILKRLHSIEGYFEFKTTSNDARATVKEIVNEILIAFEEENFKIKSIINFGNIPSRLLENNFVDSNESEVKHIEWSPKVELVSGIKMLVKNQLAKYHATSFN